MIVILGCIVVIGAVLGGFSMAGGHVHALIHPSELVTIGGATLGAMIVMSPKKVLFDLVHAMIACVKGSPFSKVMYQDTFQLMYELLRTAQRDGLLALEPHVSDPHQSAIFNKYPRVAKNHHVTAFICDGFTPLIEGSINNGPALQQLFDSELQVLDEEHHAACGVLQKAADALPGFGIVAAVLGIVITMGAIDGPVEEIGHKVGTALVGTFLGILLSYGFLGPLASRMEFLGAAESAYFRTVAYMIASSCDGPPPKILVEQARRRVGTEARPRRAELEALLKGAEGASTTAA
ncbi:MAG: flagellar motor stator protein MotA [Planctomycetaceae bacterium]